MDEAKGRTVSFQMGLKIMGTIGILMAACKECESVLKVCNELEGILVKNITRCC